MRLQIRVHVTGVGVRLRTKRREAGAFSASSGLLFHDTLYYVQICLFSRGGGERGHVCKRHNISYMRLICRSSLPLEECARVCAHVRVKDEMENFVIVEFGGILLWLYFEGKQYM